VELLELVFLVLPGERAVCSLPSGAECDDLDIDWNVELVTLQRTVVVDAGTHPRVSRVLSRFRKVDRCRARLMRVDEHPVGANGS
jgi:hypothetical protein